MNIDVLKAKLLDEWLIEEAASVYIQNLDHAPKFVQCFISGFQADNQNSQYDFVEILDCNQAEITCIQPLSDTRTESNIQSLTDTRTESNIQSLTDTRTESNIQSLTDTRTISDVQTLNDKYQINFMFDYVLTVWRHKQQLARITASAEGKCLCAIDQNNDIDTLVIKELHSQSEEYDDCTIL
ncbi:hypothetical protein EBB07_24880 [Paenibacillaceae bacterium]|nr:hypothetical protein EBB07_24880 [Paenibacillaceae bacterium]